jgi:ribosomal protein S18 acetylase RimI-like enzyme
MKFEQATEGDAEEILSLQKSAFTVEAEAYGDWSIKPLTQNLKELIDDLNNYYYLVLRQNHRIVGCVRAYFTGSECEIGRLMVDPSLQSNGYGQKLMYQIQKRFSHARDFVLATGDRSSRNVGFYKRLGYELDRKEKMSEDQNVLYLKKKADLSFNATSSNA